MLMKNPNDTIGNRTRDLPVCSAVPQPTVVQVKTCYVSVIFNHLPHTSFSVQFLVPNYQSKLRHIPAAVILFIVLFYEYEPDVYFFTVSLSWCILLRAQEGRLYSVEW
jgi:hypothetical protein